ncbi:MAG TPA: RdgB/HAM1 family non-canonical purine NTP pyrophosphatase [Opitutales bacterium]|nr:RdgB/HAM1 family non-canonical purine NTP pyrophosphatase [Opitutales bacterium]
MKTSTQIFLATGNAHKLQEFQQMFAAAALPWTIAGAAELGGMPPVEENAGTFSGNAMLKARALQKLAPKGVWVLADDSGLEVQALGGAPGVYSARYAGAGAKDGANTEKLLRTLEIIPDESRSARFVCVLALLGPGGEEKIFEGECRGRIGRTLAGGGGFGYDPVFFPDGFDKTFAELGDDVKNKISHRGRALKQLFVYLNKMS